MGGMWSGLCGISRGGAGVPARWWLVLWVLLAGLWASGEADPLWATSPTDEVGGGVGPVTDDHCSDRGHRVDGTCRACADRFYYRTSRGCVHRTGPHPLDYLCENEGESYYSSVMGCRQIYCSQSPHGDLGRDANGYCRPPPPTTTEPPSPPDAPRNVSVTPGLGSLTVSWQRAASGGEPDEWEIHYSYRADGSATAPSDSGVRRVADEAVPSGGVTLADLEPGVAYTVKVRATNDAGDGTFSSTVTATTLAPVVTLVGLEVTQGLQDWEGNIKLVKGKRTVVRAFLEPFSGQNTTVTVKLEAVRKHGSSETVVDTVYPVNASSYDWDPSSGGAVAKFTAQPDAAGRRRELDASANFELTNSRWFGSRNYVPNGRYRITYRLVVSEAIICKEAINPDNTCEASLSFKAVKQPRVQMVGIEFTTKDAPDNADLEEQAMRIESLMPIPRLDYELQTIRLPIPPPAANNDLEEVLDELQGARATHNNTSAYLGVFEGSAPGGMAYVHSNVGTWGIDNNNRFTGAFTDDRNFGSHEFGHVIGGQHSAYQDSSSDEMRTICTGDPIEGEVDEYPHILEVTVGRDRESWAALGPLRPSASVDTEVWGFDTRFVRKGPDNLAVINPREVFSLMSYCHPNGRLGVISQGVWIDEYHHPMFIDYINDRDWDSGVDTIAEGDIVPSRRIAIQGRYKVSSGGVSGSSSGEVVVRSVFTLPPESRLTAPPGDHLLEFLDGDGNVLSSISFGIKMSTGDSVWKSWLVPVIEPSGWASYRISKLSSSGAAGAGNALPVPSRTVLAEVTRSANAPTVSVTAPVAGQVFSGDEMTISWTGSDPDGDALSYDVAYSHNGGTSYRTIAAGDEFTSLTVDRKWLAGSATARVKVTASDGTRTASAESATFAVSQNAPEVFIHSPAANSIGGAGALVLDATAYDTEDGRLDASAIQWASGTDGNLGTGGHVVVYPEDLAPGLHWLTATVTDSAGAAGYAELTWVNAALIEETPPEPPAGAAAAGGNRSVTLTWDPPVAWLVTTYYQYRYRPASGAWTPWAVLHPRNRAHTIGGLSSGAHYEIEMRTATDTGFSDPVGVFASTDATVPAAPAGLTAAGGDGWVDLSWDNPGDSSITGYYVRQRPSFDDGWWCWTWIYASDKDTAAHRVTKLSAGTAYRMQIRAVNATGTGPAAEASATTGAAASPPASVPAAPAGLAGTGADRAIALSWKNPDDSSILEYQFRERPDAETGWRCWRRIWHSTPTTTSYTMNWITNGLRYQVQVRAVNIAGAGNPSHTTATPTATPGP